MPSSTLCADCHLKDGEHDIRRRLLCADCFIRYVNSKTLKRMESYRFKNLSGDQKKRLLLPLSGGVSSLILLHTLDAQLKKQLEKQNRTAYDLVLVHVVDPNGAGVSVEWYEKARLRFETHDFRPTIQPFEVFETDKKLEQSLTHLGIHRIDGDTDADFYNHILSSTSSVTTQTDLQSILLRRLLISLAKHHSCESILWGHSDSTLAAQALTAVAKGRGGSVPASISDGVFTDGINFTHPMRDLFKSELELYAQILPEPLLATTEKDLGPTPSIRNTSIDNLLAKYMLKQGEKYPSIMANVVKTASKLHAPKIDSGSVCCQVCTAQMTENRGDGQNEALCYGCERMKQDVKVGR